MFKKILYILMGVSIICLAHFDVAKKVIAQDYDAVSYDLNNITSYDFRIDGYTPMMYVGTEGVKTADLDGDHKQDIVVSGYTSTQGRSGNGSVWVVYGSLLESLRGVVKILDLSNEDHYSLRFDGARDNEMLGNCRGGAQAGDFDGDGKTDLVIPNWQSSFGGIESGSVYLISNTIFGSLAGTGNNIDMNNEANWTIRYDGASAADRLSEQGVYVADVNSDGIDDVLITSPNASYNTRDGSGSIYVASSAEIVSKKTNLTGNIVTITDSTAWWLRVDGAVAYDALGSEGSMAVADFSSNGKNDLAIGTLVANEYSGCVWLINDTILDDYTGSGNALDLASDTKYNTRICTSIVDSGIFLSNDSSTDYDNDGKLDLVVASNEGTYIIGDDILSRKAGPGSIIDLGIVSIEMWGDGMELSADYSVVFSDLYNGADFADYNGDGVEDMLTADGMFDSLGRTNNGGAFVLYNEIYNLPGEANNITVMDDVRHHSIRFDGPADYYYAGMSKGFNFGDVNGDGRQDIVLSSSRSSYNGDPFDYTGSVWVIFNFPHTVTVDSIVQSGGSTLVDGKIDASDSLTDIAGAVGSLTGADDWYSCTARDGSFDSKLEDFSCIIAGTNEANEVSIRAFDTNFAYSLTDQSSAIEEDNNTTNDNSSNNTSSNPPISTLPVVGADLY